MSDTIAALAPFLGTWRLDPDASRYEAGQPPLDGAYMLGYDGEYLHFDIEWTGADGQPQRQAIDAIPDGREHPYAGPGVDSICYTLVDAVTLDSTASLAGRVIAHARRVLQEGGAVMEIVQSGPLPGGGRFANRSLYRRADAGAGAGAGEQATLLLLERFNRALNAHDVGAMMALMTDPCVFENTWPPPAGERFVGQAAVAEFWRTLFAGAPAANIRLEELVAAGDRAFGRWVYRWGEDGFVRGVDIFRIADGKIAEKLSYVKG
jgi:predicted SnoaL-like aldol condensation-catalyzing enzyme